MRGLGGKCQVEAFQPKMCVHRSWGTAVIAAIFEIVYAAEDERGCHFGSAGG